MQFQTRFTRSTWRSIQRIANQFWRRSKKEYLCNFRSRQKWRHKKDDLSAGDLVLVIEIFLPRCQWLIGRVLQTVPGKYHSVRVVQIRTKNGMFI